MPAAIGLIHIRCIFVVFHWYKCIALVPKLSPQRRTPTTFSLTPVHCIPMAIKKFACYVPTAIGLAPVRRGVGTHFLWTASSLMLVDMGLPSHWVSWPSRGLICIKWYRNGLNASCMSELAMAPTPDLAFNKALFKAGSDPLATCWNVSNIFPWKIHSWFGSNPLSPVVVSLPSSLKWVASNFQAKLFLLIAEMTQLGPPSSVKLLSGVATTKD